MLDRISQIDIERLGLLYFLYSPFPQTPIPLMFFDVPATMIPMLSTVDGDPEHAHCRWD